MTHSSQFSQAQPQEQNDAIQQFWQAGIFSSFQGVDDKRINYAAFIHQPQAQCLVISPGRSESYLKYQELAYELFQQKINLFIIDHRGQGLSERLLANRFKGYVKHFDDYADDLHYFIDKIIPRYCQSHALPKVLAHSMGGAITLRMIQKYPNTISTALLSSPMIAINSGGLPLWLAKWLVEGGLFLNTLISNDAWYFLGQGDYQSIAFADNKLMHSPERYQAFIDLYQQVPELQLGGVTFNWLKQALTAHQQLFAELDKITTPLTILQAGKDTIVDNQAQKAFCSALNQVRSDTCQSLIVIEDAYHEILFEQDSYREQALRAIKKWLEQ
ncbi:alpha/beta fold hydrolase [Thalassotalea sp. G2M2-11]|uniref:alpha/beta fold hydrolase n=1 Tax=Thalassotalea sp. G2M2-11 TaxID=2787627 RepID=UPI0019D0EF3F|nr:alpha/beta fold hydrolase [Thalassotalea sp. G2M2-11]